MFSKKVWLALLCLVVLFGVVGVYGYVTISGLNNRISDFENQIDSLQETVSSLEIERDSLQNNVSALLSQVNALQEEIAHLQNELSHVNSTKTFVFEWTTVLIPKMIDWNPELILVPLNETLRMEMTFKVVDASLSITAKINKVVDSLTLVFDLNNDSKVAGDYAYVLMSNNMTRSNVQLFDGRGLLVIPILPPKPSPYHTCVLEPDGGCVFNASVPLPPNDLVFVRWDYNNGWNIAYFHSGIPLEES